MTLQHCFIVLAILFTAAALYVWQLSEMEEDE
jgi:hypothetical protein